MAQSAAYLTLQRYQTTQQLEQYSHPLQQALSGRVDQLKLLYKSSALNSCKREHMALKSYFIAQYNKHRPRECEMAVTLTGPHRDNLEILLHDHEARLFASEGEQRCCVTALRLAEWSRLKSLTDETPLICIDDVGLNLDQGREDNLYRELGKLGQVFLTSPRRAAHLPSDSRFIHIDGGMEKTIDF